MEQTNYKILVIRFSSLGDVILTTPVYKNLKQSFPNSVLHAAVKEKFSGALEDNPNIDRILVLKENQSIFSFLAEIRKQKYDLLIDLHNNLRSNLIALLCGIPKKIRYKKAFWQRRLFVKNRVKAPELNRHTIHRYLDTLKPLGIQPKVYPPEIHPQTARKQGEHGFRILVVQTAFLGDAVLTTPLFALIRKYFPSAKISVLCTPEIQEIFSENPNIDAMLVMDKRNKDKGLSAIFKWAHRLRGSFDIALLPHRSFRSAFIIWLAGIPKRIGFNLSQGRLFLTDLVDFDWKTHDVERNAKLLEALGIPTSDSRLQPELHWPFKNPDSVYEDFLKTHHLTKETILIGMNPGSVWKTKRWIPEHFAAVADRLMQEYPCKVALFGSSKDADSVEAVCKAMKQTPLNLCGKTDLKTLSLLISHCSLFVTNDSGPMHLACASQVPVVAIFGPTTRELGFFPYGEKSIVVELDLACRPCTLHGGEKCPLEHFKCMRNITPEMVLEPCRKFLSL